MDFSHLSVGDCTRIGTAAIAIISGIMCIKGITMVAAAVSMASVIGGIFFMVVGAGVCAAALGAFTFSAIASRPRYY